MSNNQAGQSKQSSVNTIVNTIRGQSIENPAYRMSSIWTYEVKSQEQAKAVEGQRQKLQSLPSASPDYVQVRQQLASMAKDLERTNAILAGLRVPLR